MVCFTTKNIIQNGSIFRYPKHTSGHFHIEVAPPPSGDCSLFTSGRCQGRWNLNFVSLWLFVRLRPPHKVTLLFLVKSFSYLNNINHNILPLHVVTTFSNLNIITWRHFNVHHCVMSQDEFAMSSFGTTSL